MYYETYVPIPHNVKSTSPVQSFAQLIFKEKTFTYCRVLNVSRSLSFLTSVSEHVPTKLSRN